MIVGAFRGGSGLASFATASAAFTRSNTAPGGEGGSARGVVRVRYFLASALSLAPSGFFVG
jgi:hypothetical protein